MSCGNLLSFHFLFYPFVFTHMYICGFQIPYYNFFVLTLPRHPVLVLHAATQRCAWTVRKGIPLAGAPWHTWTLSPNACLHAPEFWDSKADISWLIKIWCSLLLFWPPDPTVFNRSDQQNRIIRNYAWTLNNEENESGKKNPATIISPQNTTFSFDLLGYTPSPKARAACILWTKNVLPCMYNALQLPLTGW